MRLYVTLSYTVPLDIEDGRYSDEPLTREAVALLAEADPDVLDGFGNGPYAVHDIDWHIETDPDHMERLDEEEPSFEVLARGITPSEAPTSDRGAS